MKQKLTNICLAATLAMTFSSCEVMLADFNNYDFFGPTTPTTIQTGTNAAQTSFTNGVQWQPARYDGNGIAIYGYADGRPVYGYTKQGSLIYQVNHLYSGCYVPSWGTGAAYPFGVIRSSASPF